MNKILLAVLLAFAVPAIAQHQVPPGADPNQFQPLPGAQGRGVLEDPCRKWSW
jgi:hypothetical protein